MTEAEKKLLELAVSSFARDADYGGVSLGSSALDLALRAVLLERLPPEYEQSLRSAAHRAWDALEVVDKIRSQHPLGPEFVRRLRKEWNKERGIEDGS